MPAKTLRIAFSVATIMVPCPWFSELTDQEEAIAFGDAYEIRSSQVHPSEITGQTSQWFNGLNSQSSNSSRKPERVKGYHAACRMGV